MEAQWTADYLHPPKSKPRDIIIKLLEANDKERKQ